MDFSPLSKPLDHRFPSRLLTIDSHTAGEPTRLIFGHENLPGETMAEKRRHLMNNCDHIRCLMTREPRGHLNIFAALFTKPVSDNADFGLIYMDAKRYPFLCGHAVIGAVTTTIELGIIPAEDGIKPMIVDTPSGKVHAAATVKDTLVKEVSIEMVPAFVGPTDCHVTMADGATVTVDLVCVGGYFAMVDVSELGMSLKQENHRRLIGLGMDIIEKANEQLVITHPTRPDVSTVDVVEFYDSRHHVAKQGSSIVILGEGHMDRSPCGTGTTAKMTLFHHRKLLDLNQPYTNTSPLGSEFKGRLIKKSAVGTVEAVVAEITGSAYLTGRHEFVVDPRDPFPRGYIL